MTMLEAISCRHSVRRYQDAPLPAESRQALEGFIREINEESGLHFQLVTDHPEAFQHFFVRYGSFENVRFYIALVGKEAPDLEEKCGYYGEKLVLFAQTLGLGTCWIGGTFNRKKTWFQASEGEKLVLILSVGIPASPGHVRKSKSVQDVTEASSPPEWFLRGAEAALLAPTAINQQKFLFRLEGENAVRAIPGKGVLTQVDLGIVKCHFELAAGPENFHWAK